MGTCGIGKVGERSVNEIGFGEWNGKDVDEEVMVKERLASFSCGPSLYVILLMIKTLHLKKSIVGDRVKRGTKSSKRYTEPLGIGMYVTVTADRKSEKACMSEATTIINSDRVRAAKEMKLCFVLRDLRQIFIWRILSHSRRPQYNSSCHYHSSTRQLKLYNFFQAKQQ